MAKIQSNDRFGLKQQAVHHHQELEQVIQVNVVISLLREEILLLMVNNMLQESEVARMQNVAILQYPEVPLMLLAIMVQV